MMKILLLILILIAVRVQAQPVACGKIHGEVVVQDLIHEFAAQSGEPGRHAYDAISAMDQLPLNLLAGRETPTWSDFEALRMVRETFLRGVEAARLAEGESGVQKLYQRLDQIYSYYSRRRQLGQSAKPPGEIKYGPVDYGLRLAYRKEVEKLNRILPSNLRYQLEQLPPDLNKAKLRKQGEEIVTELESLVRDLYPTSGYKNVTELVEAIRARGNPEVKRSLEDLLNENFEFAIARPENARWWVPKVGFHNQHVTGSSGGYLGKVGRNAAEASHLKVSLKEYQNQDNDLKPKYGWLIPKLDSGHRRLQVHYGSDVFVLDKAKLRKRTTWTAGDSLNPASYWIPNWMTGETKEPTHWEHAFVPWSQRALLAPVIQGYETNNLVPQKKVGETSVGEGIPTFNRIFPNTEYVELQFWGDLTLDQVKAFVFGSSPPSGEFLEELLRRKIPIFKAESDAKTYTPWEPPAKETP